MFQVGNKTRRTSKTKHCWPQNTWLLPHTTVSKCKSLEWMPQTMRWGALVQRQRANTALGTVGLTKREKVGFFVVWHSSSNWSSRSTAFCPEWASGRQIQVEEVWEVLNRVMGYCRHRPELERRPQSRKEMRTYINILWMRLLFNIHECHKM